MDRPAKAGLVRRAELRIFSPVQDKTSGDCAKHECRKEESPLNLLVTGAAGYVGSVGAEQLLARGHNVIALDNLSEGHRQAVAKEAAFIHRDLGDAEGLDSVFREHRVDAVMHLAGESLVEKSVHEPSAFFKANVAYGIHLLDAMMRHRVRKLIFSSTAAVYGEPEITPITEEHPTLPINPYGQSKVLFERVLKDYGTSAGLRYVILRYFNAAGASERRGEDHRPETHVIPILLEAALGQREHFGVHGLDYPTPDGTCIRDYVHVLDIAEAHILALQHLERFSGQIFNVGNSRGYSVLEVLAAARSITGKPIPAQNGPRRPGDPAVLLASSEKIRRDLGWQPQVSSLENILRSAWAWKQKFPRGYPENSGTPRPDTEGHRD
jgi:UDP-glucose 4-epimerase